MTEPEHNPVARYCVVVGVPVDQLRDDVRCPACDELNALVDLDPHVGSAADGRPSLKSAVPARWVDIGARAIHPDYDGEDEATAWIVLEAVLADLRRRVEAMPTYVVGEHDLKRYDLTVSRFDVLELLETGGSDDRT